MRVARTGAKKGCSPTWYVAALGVEEQTAVLAGLLTDRSPDAGYRFALVWGLGSKAAAAKALEAMRPEVEAAVEKVRGWLAQEPRRFGAG